MRSFDEQGYFLLEGAFDAEEVAQVVAAIDPIHERSVEFLRTRGGREAVHRRGREPRVLHASRAAIGVPARLGRRACLHRARAGPDRSRRAPLLGAGGLQGAGEAACVSVASGQRVHVHRAAAVPHLLGRAHRRDHRERLSVGGARPASARHARALDDRLRLGVPPRPRRRGARARACGGHRRVLVAHASPHRAEHEWRGAQGLHRAVRARRRRGERPRPGDRGPAERSRSPVRRAARRRTRQPRRRFQNRVAERRPRGLGPGAEARVGEAHAREPGYRIDPEERARATEVAERARRVACSRPVRLLLVADLEPEAPVVR